MSFRTALILALSLVSGLSAAVGINTLRQPVVVSQTPETVEIVVATADIPRFITISTDMVTMHPYPKDLVPSGALTSVEDALDRAVYVPLMKDEPVVDSKLTAKGLRGGMDKVIPKGMEAFTIRTPDVSASMAGFILPGNKVDVLLTMRGGGGKDDPTGGGSTTPLLQAVEILAVGPLVEAPVGGKVKPEEQRSVTLLVKPQDADKLALGQIMGILHLSLRNRDDRDASKKRGATLPDILFPHVGKPVDTTPSKPEEAPPQRGQIIMYRGSQGSEMSFDLPPTGR